MIRAKLIAFLLAMMPPFAMASEECTGTCSTLLQEGFVLHAQGKLQDALDKFQKAHEASPRASLPVSVGATVLFELSTRVEASQTERIRAMARSSAELAMSLNPDDPFAYDAIRKLDNDLPPPLNDFTSPEAKKAYLEGELLFSQRRYGDALAKYKEAQVLSPQVSKVWVTAGNCHYMQGAFAEAEKHFRRATEIEPRNSQAWRFLADSLMLQRKVNDAEQALLSAIAADPGQIPNWTKLGQLRAASGLPLKRLVVKRPRVIKTQDDKFTVEVDENDAKKDSPDHTFRLALALGEVAGHKAGKMLSPFDIEMMAWRAAVETGEKMKADGLSISDPALLQMQAIAKDGQLEPAVLILMFKQTYRPEFERWLAANPGGINKFVYRYGLRP